MAAANLCPMAGVRDGARGEWVKIMIDWGRCGREWGVCDGVFCEIKWP